MLLAWDRFDDFMALPIKTELSSVAQALNGASVFVNAQAADLAG
jgi:hypothetical protein